jgi:hypothetical protein
MKLPRRFLLGAILPLVLVLSGCCTQPPVAKSAAEPGRMIAAAENSAATDVELSTDGATWTSLDDLSDFVAKKIRPQFGVQEKLTITMSARQKGVEVTRVTLTMDMTDFYLIQVNGENMPEGIVTYNNRLALDINRANMIAAIADAKNHDFAAPVPTPSVSTYPQIVEVNGKQKILKTFAFMFAESARFEDVRDALAYVLGKNESIEWHEFDALLHNWSNISNFCVANHLVKPGQKQGGASGKLLVGITTDQVDAFVRAITAEEKDVKFNQNALPFPPEYVFAPAY